MADDPALSRGVRLLLALMPSGGWRHASADEIVATTRQVVAAARRDRGRTAAFVTALAELIGLARAVGRAWLGRRLPVSTGGTDPSPKSRGRAATAVHRLPSDLRQAIRSLAATRGYTAIAIATLAIGIGVNAAVFTILDSILWRPVPFPDAARLVQLSNYDTTRATIYGGFSVPLAQHWRKQTDLFDAVEAYDRASFVYRTPAGAEMVAGAIVTPRLLTLLGVTPRLGRTFADTDGRAGTDRIVLVSEGFWRKNLGGTDAAVGQDLDLNGQRYRVVGVLPASFRFPEVRDLWTPYDLEAPPTGAPIAPRLLVPIARLARGVTAEQAAPIVTARGSGISAAAGANAGITAVARRLDNQAGDATRRSLTLLGAAVSALLLIICANVGSLTLSRALDRVRDSAVRAALGATRADLVRARVIEHALIGAIATACAILVARVAIGAALTVIPEAMTSTALNAIEVDGRMLALTLAVGIATIVVFGLPSALLGSRGALVDVLRADTRTMAGGRAANRWRSGLLIGEVALAVTLLIAGAALTRSLLRLQSRDRGFDTANLLTVTVGLPSTGYRDRAVRDRFALEAAAHIRSVSGITGTTVGGLPVDFSGVNVGEVEVGDRPGERTPQMIVPLFEVPPGYFATLGLPILHGRPFRDEDEPGSVVISDRLAKRLHGEADPIGLRFRFGSGAWLTVVGIAGDVRSLSDDAPPTVAIYYPFGRDTGAFRPVVATSIIADYRTFVVRATAPGAAVPAIAAAIHDVDPSVVIWKTTLADHTFADAIARPRAVFLMMTIFSGAGLVTAAAGLYGVLAFLVAQRRREIGIRLALGARPAEVGRIVFRRGLILAGCGAALGVPVAIALGQTWRALLFEVAPADPVSVFVVLAVLGAAAALASWWPARRAMRVDPIELLRSE